MTTTLHGRRAAAAGALLLALAAGACSGSATTPTSPDSSLPPADQTFASQLVVGGQASRSFPVPDAAVVTATLTYAGAAASTLGMGIGIPDANGANCHLFSSVEAAPGNAPHVTESVEAGTFCVAVWDLGTLQETIDFSIDISYR